MKKIIQFFNFYLCKNLYLQPQINNTNDDESEVYKWRFVSMVSSFVVCESHRGIKYNPVKCQVLVKSQLTRQVSVSTVTIPIEFIKI